MRDEIYDTLVSIGMCIAPRSRQINFGGFYHKVNMKTEIYQDL